MYDRDEDEFAELAESLVGATTAPAIVFTMIAVVLALLILLAVRFG